MHVIKLMWRRRDSQVGVLMLSVICLAVMIGPIVIPQDPYEVRLEERLKPLSLTHPLGTDQVGRDFLARVLLGGRLSLLGAIGAVACSAFLGTAIGLVCGTMRGSVDLVLMRIIDVLLAFPSLLMALFVVAILGTGLTKAVIAVGIARLTIFARTVRAVALGVRESVFVEAAMACGASPIQIMFRHILPNTLPQLFSVTSLSIGASLLHIASLGFLGLGTQPPTPEWGLIISRARLYTFQAPQLLIFPGILCAMTVLSFVILGDSLEEIFDPKRRGIHK